MAELDDFAKVIWGKRAEGLPVPGWDSQREITSHELDNLQQRFAFVQILNPESVGEFSEIKFVKAKSGWTILNYGNAMSASPGEELFAHGEYVQGEEGAQQVCSGKGTIILKIISTAEEMVRLAKDEGRWPKIYLVNGHPLMSWGIWKASQDLQIPVEGYEPSKIEEAKYQRIIQNCPKTLVSTEAVIPKL